MEEFVQQDLDKSEYTDAWYLSCPVPLSKEICLWLQSNGQSRESVVHLWHCHHQIWIRLPTRLGVGRLMQGKGVWNEPGAKHLLGVSYCKWSLPRAEPHNTLRQVDGECTVQREKQRSCWTIQQNPLDDYHPATLHETLEVHESSHNLLRLSECQKEILCSLVGWLSELSLSGQWRHPPTRFKLSLTLLKRNKLSLHSKNIGQLTVLIICITINL